MFTGKPGTLCIRWLTSTCQHLRFKWGSTEKRLCDNFKGMRVKPFRWSHEAPTEGNWKIFAEQILWSLLQQWMCLRLLIDTTGRLHKNSGPLYGHRLALNFCSHLRRLIPADSGLSHSTSMSPGFGTVISKSWHWRHTAHSKYKVKCIIMPFPRVWWPTTSQKGKHQYSN